MYNYIYNTIGQQKTTLFSITKYYWYHSYKCYIYTKIFKSFMLSIKIYFSELLKYVYS